MLIKIDDSSAPMKIRDMSFEDWRKFMAEFMSKNPHSNQAWDVMGCVRGPDSPSERPDMSPSESGVAYRGRRDRKFKTVEVIRDAMFFGVCGGSARRHRDTKVILPSHYKYDHFDKHVE